MIFWTDLETTGLDPALDTVLEVSAFLTDDDLNEIDRFHAIAHHNPNHLRMTAWAHQQHEKSGLLQEVFESKTSVFEVDMLLNNFIKKHRTPDPIPLGGSTISFDRSFLNKYFPLTSEQLHYRNIDVSSLLELHRRWSHWGQQKTPEKRNAHRATEDLEDTLALARFFKRVLQST